MEKPRYREGSRKKPKAGMLDHLKDKVLRVQLYTRLYDKENKFLNKVCKEFLRSRPQMDKSDFLRKVLLIGLKEIIRELN